MMFDITIWGALVAGLISFLSPCVLPLVPAYLGFLGGTTIDQLTSDDQKVDRTDRLVKRSLALALFLLVAGLLLPYLNSWTVGLPTSSVAFTGKIMTWAALIIVITIIVLALILFRASKRKVLLASLFFVLGLTVVFVSLGAAASFIGGFLAVYKNELGMAAGVLIILFGLHFLGILRIPLLYRSAKVDVKMESATLAGAFLMGLAFAFGWTPCVGPILTTILMIAGAEETAMRGGLLLLFYAIGIGLPFLLAALFLQQFMGFMKRFRKHLGLMEKVIGGFLILTGILIMTGGMNAIGFWLQETFPSLAGIG